MIYNIYSIRDVKTGFLTPTLDINDQSASRAFYHAVVHSSDVLGSFAPDFSLYRIGTFDTDGARLIPEVPPALVAEGVNAFMIAKEAGSDV